MAEGSVSSPLAPAPLALGTLGATHAATHVPSPTFPAHPSPGVSPTTPGLFPTPPAAFHAAADSPRVSASAAELDAIASATSHGLVREVLP